MRIAIIADVHGNYPALVAVVEDALKNEVDQFIFAGDYIFDLPFSNQVTDLIRSLDNTLVIKGNKEGYLDEFANQDQTNWNIDQFGVLHQTFRELTEGNRYYLRNLKPFDSIELPHGGRIHVTHFIKKLLYGPKQLSLNASKFKEEMGEQAFSHEEILERVNLFLTKEESRKAVADIDASVIIFGHSHLQWYGYCAGKLLINPGSCGQPLDFNICAAYSILEDNGEGLSVVEKRVPYDVEATIREAKSTEICKKGKVWCELVFAAIRMGRDEFSDFFDLAEAVAAERNESGYPFSNEAWNIAAERYQLPLLDQW